MKKILIGRDRSKCHLVLPDKTNSRLSRVHAIVELDNRYQLWITDCSTNGTYLNGKLLKKNTLYKIGPKDRIIFANEYQLDWSALLQFLPVTPKNQNEVFYKPPVKEKTIPVNSYHQKQKTNIHNEAARLFLSVIEWQERVTLIRLLWRSLSHPSNKLYEYYYARANQISPIGAYLFSMTILFIAYKITALEDQEFFNLFVPDYLQDFIPGLYGVILIVAGYIYYVFFRFLTKEQIHPKQYFYPYIALASINNIFTGLFTLIFTSMNEFLGGLLYSGFYLWILYHSINLQSQTWSISFERALLYNLLLGLITFAVVFVFSSLFLA